MLGTGHILGRRTAGQLRTKRQRRRENMRKAFSHFPSLIYHPAERKRDPYEVPKKDQQRGSKRVQLSKDPLVRIMIEDNSEVKFEEMKTLSSEEEIKAQAKRRSLAFQRQAKQKGTFGTAVWHFRAWLSRCLTSQSSKISRIPGATKLGSFCRRSNVAAGIPQVLLNGGEHNEVSEQTVPLTGPLCAPLRARGGRVNSTCLWHAFRAVAVGIFLICVGIVLSIKGYLDDQMEIEARLESLNMTQAELMYAPGMVREDKFRLNNYSFAGPVVMGIGGFLIVASCVMTFESRDNAAKVVPSALTHQPSCEEKSRFKGIRFRVSSSQTTFLDRNIVETLNPSSQALNLMSSNCLPKPTEACKVSGPIAAANPVYGLSATSFQSGSSHTTTKRASFDGWIPQVESLQEEGLAIMDEIGRQALTNAFINFIRNTSDPSSYRDSLIYEGCCVSSIDNEIKKQNSFRRKHPNLTLEIPQSIPKCPSAPNITHHKLDPNVKLDQIPVSNGRTCNTAPVNPSSSPLIRTPSKTKHDPTIIRGQYKVLTPTMYRSRMAATRQAQSMDCEGSNGSKFRREGPALRIPSPFRRPLKPLNQDSLELELGASASEVHQINQSRTLEKASLKDESEHSDTSMVMDLHVEGSAPVTLLIRDESRSTRSTSGNRETTSTTRSHSRSPAPSLGRQMSREKAHDELDIQVRSPTPSLTIEMTTLQQRRHSEPLSSSPDVEDHGADAKLVVKNRKYLGSHSCEEASTDPQPCDAMHHQNHRFCKSLTFDLEMFSFIDTEESSSSSSLEMTSFTKEKAVCQEEPCYSGSNRPSTGLDDEEKELFMEFESDDFPDTTEVFPVVFSITPQPSSSKASTLPAISLCASSSSNASSSSTSTSMNRRHLLVRQAKLQEESSHQGQEDKAKQTDEDAEAANTITF